MASTFWKLVIAPLQAPGEVVEVVVTAENWLSGLRLARQKLGEQGGVPPGASCVMAATGEVTIVDMSSRRRFTLSRTTEQPDVASPAQAAVASPAQAAAASPAQAAASPAQSKIRASTMAYSPEESAAIRAQLVAANTPGAPPSAPAVAPQAPRSVAAPATPTPPAPNVVKQVPAGGFRSSTVAYAPEESAAARAQLVAAQQAAAGSVPRAPAPVAPSPAPASSAKKSTVAYLENPFAPGSAALVVVSKRDEEPSAASPLLYRERCYFSPTVADRALAQHALQQELSTLRAELNPAQRGVFISLALFDHYFDGKPTRGPVATLQWKDWRGEPAFAWHGTQAPAAMPSHAQDAVRTSFVPGVQPAASPVAAPPVQKLVPAAPEAQPARAPSAALFTPLHGPKDSWPPVAGTREPTGDHDRRLAVAFEAVQDLYFLGSVAEGMDFGVKLLSDLVPCQAVTGCIYDINTNELRFVALTGPGADERRAGAIPASAGLLGLAALSTKESLVIADVANDARFDPAADGRLGLEALNMLLLPLHKAENLLGVVQLINRTRSSGFDSADIAVGAYVAGQLAAFLQSKRTTVARRPR